MGAIESTEAGNLFENAFELAKNTAEGSNDLYYQDYEYNYGDESYPRERNRRVEEEEEEELEAAENIGAQSAATVAAATHRSPKRTSAEEAAQDGASPSRMETTAKRAETEILNHVGANEAEVQEQQQQPQQESSDFSISKSQKTAPGTEETKTTADHSTIEVVRISRSGRPSIRRDAPFAFLFVLQVLLLAAGIVYLNIVYLRNWNTRKFHNLERWFPQLCAAIIVGSLFAGVCQLLFKRFPSFMARSTVWISSFLTLATSLMLISSNSAASLGVGVICLVLSVCQSLYACWVSSRVKYAGDLIFHSLNAVSRASGVYLVSYCMLLLASLWTAFWSFGVVSALTFPLAPLVVLALLVTLVWTMETLRNVVYAVTAANVAAVYGSGSSSSSSSSKRSSASRSLFSAFTSWFGSICLGSFIVPVLHTLRVVVIISDCVLNAVMSITKVPSLSHRPVVSTGYMEIMSSCFHVQIALWALWKRWLGMPITGDTHRYFLDSSSSSVCTRHFPVLSVSGQVAIHNEAFVRASEDAYELFNRSTHLHVVIDTDLTSAFCVLSGVSGGMLSALVSGGWVFATHKPLTTSLSVLAFFIGYFLVRITMAVPQGSVAAHYLCYAESPNSEGLASSPVNERLSELLEAEVGKTA